MKRSKGGKRATAHKGVSVKGGGFPIVGAVAKLTGMKKLTGASGMAVTKFRARLAALQAMGLRRTQIKKVVGVSYSAIHGFVSGRIAPSIERLKEYNANIDAWVSRAKKV